jgi:hypothetical protein
MSSNHHQHHDSNADGNGLPLIRCRACGSSLLQLERIWLLADGRHAAERRCPECERHDLVVADPRALAVWAKRERQLLETLEELAAALGTREAPESVPPAGS